MYNTLVAWKMITKRPKAFTFIFNHIFTKYFITGTALITLRATEVVTIFSVLNRIVF